MYPSGTKFQTRPTSPQFPNITPPDDYPHPSSGAAGPVESLGSLHHAMKMRHPKTMSTKSRPSVPVHAMSNTMSSKMAHHRNDMMYHDDLDNIEICMPKQMETTNGIPHGINGDMLLMHGMNGFSGDEQIPERRRRGHLRRSNHKTDVEQQVKWSRRNIAATMERFEPTPHSSSSASSLEYGFAAGVVTPSATPLRQPQMSSPSHLSYSNGSGAVGGAILPSNHVYSYAYYEPGAAKCHINVPHSDANTSASASGSSQHSMPRSSKSPPRNSIRALLARSLRSKSNSGHSTSSSPCTEDRHTYTTRYGTTENLYEEVNEQKIRKVLSDNRIAPNNIDVLKEEQRRVQHNHFRVLDELNLSLEALIMPQTPTELSPKYDYDDNEPSTSAATAAASAAASSAGTEPLVSSSSTSSQRPRRGGLLGGASSSTSSTSSQHHTLSHGSLENLSNTLHSMELKDHTHSSCINPDFDEGDLDSGFSGSGSSSGASYNESLRYYKTGNSISKSSMTSEDQVLGMMTMLGSCGQAATAPTGATSSAGIGNHCTSSPFNFARRCSEAQRASSRSMSASSSSTTTGTKPKKNFWTIKP